MGKNNFFNGFKKHLKAIDSAELGRELKRMAMNVRLPRGNIVAHMSLASRLLAYCTYESGSIRMEQVVKNLTINGNNVGDYKITVERVEK